MALDFPSNPSNGDTYENYVWNDTVGAWQSTLSGGGGTIDVSSTAPTGPSEGNLWWDSDNGNLYIYYDDGDTEQWVAANGPQVFVGTAAPSGYQGQLWFDSSTGNTYIYYDDGSSAQWVQAIGGEPIPNPTPKNLLYNGAMQVAQRGTSATGIGNGDTGYHTADRWGFAEGGASTAEFTQTIEDDGPTGSGFTKSLKMEVTTADVSLAAADVIYLQQFLEGQDLQGLKKGTSSAESLTLSFWVKSDTTGTYIINIRDRNNSRLIAASYSIASSDTWEQKTVTFAGDTTGAFTNDNNKSLELDFWLAAGSDFNSGTLATSWESLTNANRAVGQTNLAASTSNYWQITGVQLETGNAASNFEHKPYGVELAECQRYYWRISGQGAQIYTGYCGSSTNFRGTMQLPVTPRTVPSFTSSGDAPRILANGFTTYTTTGISQQTATDNISEMRATVSSGLTAGEGGYLILSTVSDSILEWDAEL